jgi:hypothetical protein
LKLGSRVRCTDDGVEGRIIWANAVSVKIKWKDGEEVTWRRDSLASRSIELLNEIENEEQPERPDEAALEPLPPTEPSDVESASPTPVLVKDEPAHPAAESPEAPGYSDTSGEPAPDSVKPKRQRKSPAKPQEKKLSALDAAFKVLGETAQPMTCQEMIEEMVAKGYWVSPKGRTPAATLYSAVLREITSKGKEARFVKTERGKFARNGVS